MVDEVMRAILKLAFIAVLSMVVFYGIGIWVVSEFPPREFPQYRGAEKMLGAGGALATFFGLGFYIFRKRS
jgi:hypothetical protein